MSDGDRADDRIEILDVGVIIVTHNSAAHFAILKASLEALSPRPARLVVVDSGSVRDQKPSPDDFPEYAELILSDENIGFAAANNLAATKLDTAWIGLLNPDAFPAANWLGALMSAAMAHPEAVSFGSTQISFHEPSRYDGLGDCYHVFGLPWRSGYGVEIDKVERIDGPIFSACAAAALYRTDVWRELDGFDERYYCYCEDVDLGFRIRLAGYDVRQVADAVVSHVGGASSGKRSHFSIFYGTRNRFWLFAKCMPSWTFWLFAPGHVVLTLSIIIWASMRGTLDPTLEGIRAGFKGVREIAAARRHLQTSRKASVVSLLRFMAISPLTALRRMPLMRSRMKSAL